MSPFNPLPFAPDWSWLHVLVLQSRGLRKDARLLDNFPSTPRLSEVTLECRLQSISTFADTELVPYGVQLQWHEKLEQALLKFSLPRIIGTFHVPVRANSLPFWGCELGRKFPALFLREEIVVLKCKEGESFYIICAGIQLIPHS